MIVRNLGRVVEGHVLDVNKKQFEKELKRIEERLYLKWNPVKNKGFGCWEIRIKPTKLTPVYQGSFKGSRVFTLESVENQQIHHILDVGILNYRILSRLREMDTQGKMLWIDNMDYEAEREESRYQAKVDQVRKDMIRDNRKYFKDLQEYVKSGYNPAWFFSNHSLK